jgi:8-oxo-dGTP diphosphatase
MVDSFDTGTLYLVRHAKAGDRSRWSGDDVLRPLSGKGRRQAVSLCERLLPLVVPRPDAILLSSSYLRCLQTLEPLAARLHSRVLADDRLTEGASFEGVLDMIESIPNGSVMCSHGDIIPAVIAALERRHTNITTEPDWRKGSVWVLDRRGSHIETATVWSPPDVASKIQTEL